MSGHGHQIFTDGLARLATHTAAPGLAALARRVGAPVTVAVHGRHGVGVSTVAAVLTAAGIRVRDADADIDVRVDRRGGQAGGRAALAAERPTLVVLNKADLTGFAAGGPIEAARRRCADLAAAYRHSRIAAGRAAGDGGPGPGRARRRRARCAAGPGRRARRPEFPRRIRRRPRTRCPAPTGNASPSAWTCSGSRTPCSHCAARRTPTPTNCVGCCGGSVALDEVCARIDAPGRRGALRADAGGDHRIGGDGRPRRRRRRVPELRSDRRSANGRRRRSAERRGNRGRYRLGKRRHICVGPCAGTATAPGRSPHCTAPAAPTSCGDRCGCLPGAGDDGRGRGRRRVRRRTWCAGAPTGRPASRRGTGHRGLAGGLHQRCRCAA